MQPESLGRIFKLKLRFGIMVLQSGLNFYVNTTAKKYMRLSFYSSNRIQVSGMKSTYVLKH